MTATATKAPWTIPTELVQTLPTERRGSRRLPLGLLAVGGAAIIAASALAFNLVTADAAPTPASTSALAPAVAETFPDVGLAESVYPIGHSSGWHVHPGVHSVVVRTGTLTIYDDACQRTEFGPGQSYIGGNRAHVARNEGSELLDVVITYVYVQTTTADHGSVVAAPAGCDVR